MLEKERNKHEGNGKKNEKDSQPGQNLKLRWF